MSTNRLSVLIALEGSDEHLRAALRRADAGLDQLAARARTAGERASAGLAQVQAGASTFSDQIARATRQFVAFLAVFELGRRATEVIALADAWNQMDARLKLATAGTREFAIAQRELFAIAQRIGVPVQELADLYGKLQQSVRQLGGSQREALTITQSVAQALRLSGASANASQGALLQFGQALASGVLRGEEFNSIVEQTPRLSQALADGLNVPIGRLRKLAEQGQLTADVVVRALLSQKDRLAAEYAQLPPTVAQAFTRLTNAFGQWAQRVDQSTGLTRKLAAALDWLSQHLDTVMRWLGRIAEVGLAVLIYRLIPALITAWQTAGAAAGAAAATTSAAWAAANQSLSGAITQVGTLRVAFAVMAAAWAGWEIGTWLSERFAIVRKAGVFLVDVLMHSIERLRFHWEAFAAFFTGDTIDAATARHVQRLSEMRQIFADMYVDAEQSQAAQQQAADAATAAAQENARRLAAIRQGTQEAVGRGAEAVTAALTQLDQRLGSVETTAARARQAIDASLSRMAESYQTLADGVQASLDRQLALHTAHQAQALADLVTNHASQRETITRTADLQAEASVRQTRAQQGATAEVLRLIEEESATRRVTAERQQQDTTRIEGERLAAQRQSLSEALAAYQRHVEALNAEANRHLAEVRRIEDEKRALSQSTEERIRELRRSAMDTFSAYQDRLTQVAQLQAQAREALTTGEFDRAKQYAQQAADLAAQTAQAVRQGDQEVVSQKEAVQRAIEAVRRSEALTIEALDGEAQAHRQAADAATDARSRINATLNDTQGQLDAIAARLQDTMTLSIGADTTALDQALDTLERTLAEREHLVTIKADLSQAERQFTQWGELLKAGQSIPVTADVSAAEHALGQLADYAKTHNAVDLKVSTEKAQAAVQNVERQITALATVTTESRHTVRTNADVARADVLSLDGTQTHSTHTIHVRRVEENAAGGLVGLARYASGGQVAGRYFPTLRGGKVSGSGDGDTVPRTLDAGSFVLRKAAVRHYGEQLLARVGQSPQRFAIGGPVRVRQNRDVAETVRLIDLGLQGMDHYAAETERRSGPGTSMGFRRRTMDNYGTVAAMDRQFLASILGLKSLTGTESARLQTIQSRWRSAMGQALLFGKDYERALIEWREQQDPAQYYARGGRAQATSDTVPALLTPGEYVVRRDVVQRLGTGFFDALNRLQLPRERLAQRVRGYATGGLVSLTERAARSVHALRDGSGTLDVSRVLGVEGSALARPPSRMQTEPLGMPARTIRVELAAGAQRVGAMVAAHDETRLLDLLKAAQARTT